MPVFAVGCCLSLQLQMEQQSLSDVYARALEEPERLAAAIAVMQAVCTASKSRMHLVLGLQLYFVKYRNLARKEGHGQFTSWWEYICKLPQCAHWPKWTGSKAQQVAKAGNLVLCVMQKESCGVLGEKPL